MSIEESADCSADSCGSDDTPDCVDQRRYHDFVDQRRYHDCVDQRRHQDCGPE